MKELEYPFDTDYILTKKKIIKRILLNQKEEFLEKNIAILGGSTTNNLKLVLELFLLNYGIRPYFYESQYNQYYYDAVFPNAELESFNPDIIYIYTTNRNIENFPKLYNTKEEIDDLIKEEINKYKEIWNQLKEKYHCPIVQNNFEMPSYRFLGNKDASDIHGVVNYLSRLNDKFYSYAQNHKNFYICDINYISADYGLQKWFNETHWYMYKYAFDVSAIPYVAFNVANIIKSIYGKNKKGLILDLDNTLWGGIIGDDGVENIQLGVDDAEGQAYIEFQKYIKSQKQLGIILNINSKNNYENVIAGLNHPDSRLVPDDFIEIRANWNSKDQNFIDIADSLNLLPESFVFVDDNPAERHIVTEQIPGVCAPDIDKVTNFIRILDRSAYFEATTLSDDDLKRCKMYKSNREREKLKVSFSNYKEYLISLNMTAIIKEFNSIYLARIVQLINKSNQFNLTTRRYTQGEIENIMLNKDYITLYGKLSDRFGDNGVVTAVIGHIMNRECHIDLWVMSCRVFKRELELAVLDELIRCCKERKINCLYGYYYPTAKNNMVQGFFEIQGFTKVSEDEIGNSVWNFELPEIYERRSQTIRIEE